MNDEQKHAAPGEPAMTDSVLEVRGVRRAFKRPHGEPLVVLESVNLNLHKGEIIGLLGRSGSGKSTLLRIVAGLIKASDGEVIYRGEPLHGPAEGISMVFQSFALFPWLTVQQNVEAGLEAQGMAADEIREQALRAIDLIGLDGFANAYPRELSGGMRMRVSIARALVTEPELLLMDEPFAALDEITRFKLNDDLLRMWQALRTTVVFVTHSVFESVYLSSRVVVMAARPGRVFTELEVDAPYPRDPHFRTSPEYAAHCRRASEALAMAAGGEP